MNRIILIVDDSKTERVVLNGYLKGEYETLEATNGEEALALLRERHEAISAIVMDVIMPGMDGFEALKAIKANAAWQSIPVIITTGMDDEEARERAISCGADNFITKPFHQRLLLHVMQSAIRQRETAALANALWRAALTGLLNKESFFDEARRMIQRQADGFFMLACFDVENFKVINDQYGTDVGDEVLRHIANGLNGFAAENNGLACRYMADKFIMLYPAQLKDSPQGYRCHEQLVSPACLGRPIRIRVGRYLVIDRELPVSAMFDRASMAEESIKGRFDVFRAEYTEDMREQLLREQQITGDMVGALQNGEFEPWLQPQYNHATGALVGAEALVRWRKDGGIVPPGSFIPVFEKNGFIYEVDQAVWRQVCALLRRWLDEGKSPVPVSVNISRYDLYQEDFLSVITGLVREYGLPADLLRLEITESAFADSAKAVISVANELIALGFTVEIDDFGSGYSSLNTLKDVPASILKLDMRFFETTANSQRGGNIIESVVRMAKWLNMAVIAEGVEEQAQADYLESIGCYYIQGYFYAKPMPVAEYEQRQQAAAKEPRLARLHTLATLNNNEFWNPKSMETLIFNSYVGGACIFEHCHEELELLRINDQYGQELGGLVPEGAELKDSSILPFIDETGLAIIRSALREAIEQKREAMREGYLRDGDHIVQFANAPWPVQLSNFLDITDQVQAEQKRLETAEQLTAMMGNVNGSVSAFLMDDVGNTTLIFGNDNYYGIFGYTKEQAEAVHLDVMSCIAPEDYDMVVGKLNQLKRDGVPVILDYRAVKRDGSLIYIRSNSSRMRMAGYGDQVIVSVETDITETRTLEDQLRAVVDNINGGVSATCLRGAVPEFVLVNDKYFEIIGYTREQFEAEITNVFELVHPDDRERVEGLFREAATDQQPYTMEYRILRRNGAIRHILCNTNVMRLFGMEEPVQLAVSNDITVLREAQRSERDLSLQMQAIMSNIRGGITAAVVHSRDDVEIVFANDGFYEMYGYTKQQLADELPSTLELIVPEDRERTMDTVARIARERGSKTYEYRCRKRDGSLMWTQATNAVISLTGVGDAVLLAIITDITALRVAERESMATMDRLHTVMNAMNSGMTAVAFYGDHTRFLFANDRYYELHGITRAEYEQVTLGESLALVHPDDRAMLRELVTGATQVGQHAEAEYRIQRPDGTVRWAKAAMTVTRLVDVDVPVQVTVFADIDAEKTAADQLRFLNESAHDILAQPDSDAAIALTLRKVLDYFQADRAYVVELDEARRLTSNTYEVCAEGVASERARLQALAFDPADSGYQALCNDQFVVIENASELKECDAALRALLAAQGIRALIVAPLRRDGRLIGFMGADNPAHAMGQVGQLTALADYVSVLLTRRALRRRIDSDSQTVRQLMDDTPGGFLRMEITPDHHVAIDSFNEGFCHMLGMTRDEAMAAYGEDALACIAAEDVAAVRADSAAARAERGQFTSKCRLIRKGGDRLWAMVFGRYASDETGRLYLNAYFTDITAQKTAEQQQIELLDNLPSGAALYELDGGELKIIHINKRYWKLVGRESNGLSVLDAVHPADRELIRQEIESAIRQHRNAEADARILCGADEYRPFHITANIRPRRDGRHLLYASYTPISEETMSIQEMLPVALSTMIATTDDISYVKDKDLRYLCVSQSVADMAGCANPRDLIGKSAEEVFDRKFAEKFNADDGRILETGVPVVNALEHIPTAAGGVCLARTSKFPILGPSGAAIGVYCVSYDVTAQKEKESQLELLTSSIPGGLAAYSLSGEGITTLYFNEGYYAFSGYTREEYVALTEQEPLALMVEEDRPRMLAMVRRFAAEKRDGMTGSCAYRCRTKAGGTRWMSLKAVLSQVGEDTFVLNAAQLDVTDQMEVENRRAELLDNLPFGAALFQFDGERLTPVHINRQYAKLVGREANSPLTGLPPEDYIHPDDRAIALDEMRDAIAHHRDACCELRLLCGKSDYRPFRLDARITPKAEGQWMLYVAYTPITEQEQSLEALLPRMFHTIMESATDSAFAKDINFRYLCCSKTFLQLLGLASEKDVVGKTDYELFPKEIAEQFRRSDSALFANGEPQVDILEAIPSADGTRHYTRTTKHLLRDAAGNPMGVYCVGRDVTDIREAYLQLRLLTDTIPGGIATFRCLSGSIEPIYFNDGVCELAGYSREEYVRRQIPVLELVLAEDRPTVHRQMALLERGETALDFTVRIHTGDGGCKWLHSAATVTDQSGDGSYIVNAVLTDITLQQAEKERLRLAEEAYRIATRHSNRTICRYDIATRTLAMSEAAAARLGLPLCIPDVPEGRVAQGEISKETEAAYLAFFDGIRRGDKECEMTFCKRLSTGWRWIEAQGTPLFGADGKPVSAVISYTDVTEQREKEAVYTRWQNSLRDRPEDSYALFRCNLSKSASYDSWAGKLLRIDFDPAKQTFNERTAEYIAQCVYAEDRERYRAFLNADTLLAEYYRGRRTDRIEYRECAPDGTTRWLRLTVDLVEYPDSNDVEAYLMYENIDEQKRAQLQTIERAETDPLTGVLNRVTFSTRVNQLISLSRPGAQHALLMLDMDGFKQVNDVFGHGVGDQALSDIAAQLTKFSRKGDLVGRLGGDEFMVFLADIAGEADAAGKARQICELTRKTFSMEVRISASIGVALYPQDGESFKSLYRAADETLYRVKDAGKNGYMLSDERWMEADAPEAESASAPYRANSAVPRMLIVEDNAADFALLNGIFHDEYRIERAADGATALAKLRHYGTAISVVLLDLTLPGVEGMEVLRRVQLDTILRAIPVIVVSGDDRRETALSAIEAGAADFVTKPVEIELLRLRVACAVSKADSERQRAKTSYLSLRDSEMSGYQAVLERIGLLVITLDWGKSEFHYSPTLERVLAGRYNGRGLWRVLLSDRVADAQTVQEMQRLVHQVAEDRTRMDGGMQVRLKIVSGAMRPFEFKIYKEVNEFGLANQIILTLREQAAAPAE